jgi:phage-related minor tail protein
MLQEIDRRKVLIGLTEEQAKRQELVYQTEDKLGKFRNKYGNDFVNNIVNQTMALDEQQKVLDEARARQEEIADVISSSFGDAFTSIVDGTSSVKDAFRNMASYVVKELFRIIVVQQMVDTLARAITGTSAAPTSTSIPPPPPRPFANGGALYGGNVIPFAKGGVVGSPMMFPMAGGNTGLMGEAGPEAIMPLKRGKGGKLGVVAENSGNVVINQSFNFSANGDESVKKIIAQAAPQIAQMTKTSIINDRRRGGSTKAAFG